MTRTAQTAATDAERADAERDIKAYMAAMMAYEGHHAALRIERRWGLDGYTPQIVSTVLHLVSQGVSLDDAESRALGQDDPDSTA